MKRIFVLILAAGFFASCSNSGDAAKDIKDSIDSTTNEKVESIDNAAEQAKDTTKQAADSLKEKVDSVANKVADSTKK